VALLLLKLTITPAVQGHGPSLAGWLTFASSLTLLLSGLPVVVAFGLAAILTLSIQLGPLPAGRRTTVAR
jgi:hypothetical protein